MPSLRQTRAPMYRQEDDEAISQANPVSATLYTVLDTVKNCRLISISCNITWAVTQPDPLEVVVTIDGQTLTFSFTNPVSATDYVATIAANLAPDAQPLVEATALTPDRYRPFILEGHSVKVQVRVTWATTQPTPLVCRVKYALRR